MLLQRASLVNSPLWNAFLLDKTGYHGMLRGAIWTCCFWLIVRYCNMRNIYWKL